MSTNFIDRVIVENRSASTNSKRTSRPVEEQREKTNRQPKNYDEWLAFDNKHFATSDATMAGNDMPKADGKRPQLSSCRSDAPADR